MKYHGHMKYDYELSVISPVFNEEGSLHNFVAELYECLGELDINFEVILIDDRSLDNSWIVMNEIIKRYKNISIIQHNENKGHVVALESGFHAAKGEWLLTLDSDLQHPPTLISKLWDLRTQSPVISTKQIARNDMIFKKMLSSFFYPLLRAISGVKVNPNVGDFRLIRSDIIQELLSKNEFKMIRFQIPKYRISEKIIDYQARERFAGKTSYNLPRMLRLGEESLIMLTKRPLYWGLWFFSFYFLAGVITLTYGLVKYTGQGEEGTLLIFLTTLILFASASISLTVGMLGVYLSHLMGRLRLYPSATISKVEKSS